jgi:S1-C subfamily serine protease
MSFRLLIFGVWSLAWLVVFSTTEANAQTTRHKPRPKQTAPAAPAPTPTPTNTSTIVLRREVPGLVYVRQTIDLRPVEETLMTLDGEPAPPLLVKNVTLGVVVDDEGHIVTRLVGVTPSNPPHDILVLGQGINKPAPARFLGLDSVSGLCILKVEGASLSLPQFAEADKLPLQRSVKVRGFNPQQGQNQSAYMTIYPRIYDFDGQVVKAVKDFRYNASNPLYQLTAPRLTPVQDCSLVFTSENALFGIALYDTTSEGRSIVYPISRVREIVAKVAKSNESIAYGWLGATPDVNMPSVIPTQITGKQAKLEFGVRVRDVFPDSPAEEAGIRPRDILLSINERRVESSAQLMTALRQLPPDSEITIRLRRDNEYKTVKARLVPAPSAEPNQQLTALLKRLENLKGKLHSTPLTDPNRERLKDKVETFSAIMTGITQSAPPEVKLRVFYGLEAQPATAQLLGFLGAPNGVLVTTINENNRAAQSGLQAGDVITKVGTKAINDLADLLQALDGANSPAEITVVRRRATLTLKFSR